MIQHLGKGVWEEANKALDGGRLRPPRIPITSGSDDEEEPPTDSGTSQYEDNDEPGEGDEAFEPEAGSDEKDRGARRISGQS